MDRMIRNKPALRLACLLLVLGFAPLGVQGQSPPQKGFEFSGLPRPEFMLEELRALVGRTFWVRRPEQKQPPKALFCETQAPAGACPGEKFGVAADERFTIDELIVGKPNPALSWLKIKLASGKTAYLSVEDFREHRYSEARLSPTVHDIDTIIANSGWIFDDYPPRILNERRMQLEARSDPKREQERLEKERVMRHSLLYVGMTAQQVLNTTWGPPNNITTTIVGWRRLEQWDYGAGNVLHFEDGRLVRVHPFGR